MVGTLGEETDVLHKEFGPMSALLVSLRGEEKEEGGKMNGIGSKDNR